MKLKNNNKGFTFIETVVSLAIITVILICIFPVYKTVLNYNHKNDIQSEMIFYGISANQQGTETQEITGDDIEYNTVRTGNYVETTVTYENINYKFKRYVRRY